MTTSDPARWLVELEARRLDSGIRLDEEGRWWHRGELIEHTGIADAFHRWLERDEQGRYVLRTDRDWCVVEVDDAPLVARAVELRGDRAWLRLSDGTSEELRYETLEQGADHVLYSRATREWPIRFSRPAYYALAERLDPQSSEPSLLLAGTAYVIPTRR